MKVADKPILIEARSLGMGRPAQELIVSPQHRILVGGARQLMQYFTTEAFAPAKALTGLRGIRHMKGKSIVTWVHFACNRHEVVIANSCISESLLIGSMVVNGLTRAERRELSSVFAAVTVSGTALNGLLGRACLPVAQVRQQLAEHAPLTRLACAKDIQKWDVDAAMERYEAGRLHNQS